MSGLVLIGLVAAVCFVMGTWFLRGKGSRFPGVVFIAFGLIGMVAFAGTGYSLGEGSAKENPWRLSDGIYSVESVGEYSGATHALLAECEVGAGEMKKSDNLLFFRTRDPAIAKALVAGDYVQADGAKLLSFAFPRGAAPAPPKK